MRVGFFDEKCSLDSRDRSRSDTDKFFEKERIREDVPGMAHLVARSFSEVKQKKKDPYPARESFSESILFLVHMKAVPILILIKLIGTSK